MNKYNVCCFLSDLDITIHTYARSVHRTMTEQNRSCKGQSWHFVVHICAGLMHSTQQPPVGKLLKRISSEAACLHKTTDDLNAALTHTCEHRLEETAPMQNDAMSTLHVGRIHKSLHLLSHTQKDTRPISNTTRRWHQKLPMVKTALPSCLFPTMILN